MNQTIVYVLRLRASFISPLRVLLSLTLVVVFLGQSVSAAGKNAASSSGRLILRDTTADVIEAPLLDTQVEMNISGLIARVKVVQRFENRTAYWVEGEYMFPLPEKSAVDGLSIKIGERLIVGEIREKTEAKRLYHRAKISGRKASLVQQYRPNIFTNSVANIAPFEIVEVSIEYQQEVQYNQDNGFNIRFPMTMTPRYKSGHLLQENLQELSTGFRSQEQVQFNNHSMSDVDTNLTNPLSLSVNLDAGIPLEVVGSRSHSIQQHKKSQGHYTIQLDKFSHRADRDFELSWKPRVGKEPRAALFSEIIDDEQYLSVMLLPPRQPRVDLSLAREIIFVIDTSGSMAGESIKQAKRALRYGLTTLRLGDSFNVIEFNSSVTSLFLKPRAADQSSLAQAQEFVMHLSANGGTEMSKAMNAALDSNFDSHRIRQVIFLTDGAISNEAAMFQQIEQGLGDSRLFTVGIGSAPNGFFMKRAARFGRGTFTFISEAKEAETKLKELFDKISLPMLTHIDIQWPANTEVEMWPEKIPDLFSGEPILVKAKTKHLDRPVRISGRLTNGLWQTEASLDINQNHLGVAKLWAREKIASVMNQSKHGKPSQQGKQEIIDTALQHHLVSRFTSLIAVDKTPSNFGEGYVSKKIPQNQPFASKPSVGNYPKTGLIYWLDLKLAMMMVILALVGLFIERRLS